MQMEMFLLINWFFLSKSDVMENYVVGVSTKKGAKNHVI
jgi:hypothetical protein